MSIRAELFYCFLARVKRFYVIPMKSFRKINVKIPIGIILMRNFTKFTMVKYMFSWCILIR